MADWELLLRGLARRVRILEVRNPLENAAIDRGGLYVLSNEGLVVEGSAKVSGYLVVTGTLKGTGTFDWSGVMNISGQQNVTGPTTFTGQMTVNGPWKFVGAGEITGNVKLTGDFEVLPGGRIKVNGMIIDPANGGSVTFPGGAIVRAGSDGGIEMRDGSYGAVVTSVGASVGRVGRSISVTENGGFRMDGVPQGSPGPDYPRGVLYKNTLGEVREASGS